MTIPKLSGLLTRAIEIGEPIAFPCTPQRCLFLFWVQLSIFSGEIVVDFTGLAQPH
jgi:hypothetical protein